MSPRPLPTPAQPVTTVTAQAAPKTVIPQVPPRPTTQTPELPKQKSAPSLDGVPSLNGHDSDSDSDKSDSISASGESHSSSQLRREQFKKRTKEQQEQKKAGQGSGLSSTSAPNMGTVSSSSTSSSSASTSAAKPYKYKLMPDGLDEKRALGGLLETAEGAALTFAKTSLSLDSLVTNLKLRCNNFAQAKSDYPRIDLEANAKEAKKNADKASEKAQKAEKEASKAQEAKQAATEKLLKTPTTEKSAKVEKGIQNVEELRQKAAEAEEAFKQAETYRNDTLNQERAAKEKDRFLKVIKDNSEIKNRLIDKEIDLLVTRINDILAVTNQTELKSAISKTEDEKDVIAKIADHFGKKAQSWYTLDEGRTYRPFIKGETPTPLPKNHKTKSPQALARSIVEDGRKERSADAITKIHNTLLEEANTTGTKNIIHDAYQALVKLENLTPQTLFTFRKELYDALTIQKSTFYNKQTNKNEDRFDRKNTEIITMYLENEEKTFENHPTLKDLLFKSSYFVDILLIGTEGSITRYFEDYKPGKADDFAAILINSIIEGKIDGGFSDSKKALFDSTKTPEQKLAARKLIVQKITEFLEQREAIVTGIVNHILPSLTDDSNRASIGKALTAMLLTPDTASYPALKVELKALQEKEDNVTPEEKERRALLKAKLYIKGLEDELETQKSALATGKDKAPAEPKTPPREISDVSLANTPTVDSGFSTTVFRGTPGEQEQDPRRLHDADREKIEKEREERLVINPQFYTPPSSAGNTPTKPQTFEEKEAARLARASSRNPGIQRNEQIGALGRTKTPPARPGTATPPSPDVAQPSTTSAAPASKPHVNMGTHRGNPNRRAQSFTSSPVGTSTQPGAGNAAASSSPLSPRGIGTSTGEKITNIKNLKEFLELVVIVTNPQATAAEKTQAAEFNLWRNKAEPTGTNKVNFNVYVGLPASKKQSNLFTIMVNESELREAVEALLKDFSDAKLSGLVKLQPARNSAAYDTNQRVKDILVDNLTTLERINIQWQKAKEVTTPTVKADGPPPPTDVVPLPPGFGAPKVTAGGPPAPTDLPKSPVISRQPTAESSAGDDLASLRAGAKSVERSLTTAVRNLPPVEFGRTDTDNDSPPPTPKLEKAGVGASLNPPPPADAPPPPQLGAPVGAPPPPPPPGTSGSPSPKSWRDKVTPGTEEKRESKTSTALPTPKASPSFLDELRNKLTPSGDKTGHAAGVEEKRKSPRDNDPNVSPHK
ncbi:MAG: hypothetical protein K0R63_153 [Rickettsiales bacterium]|nr:hypothetical protein [Rickettsiales bacterium]